MLKIASAAIALIIVVCIGLPVVLISAVFGGGGGGCGTPATLPSDQPVIDGWDAEQISIAAVIVNVGASRGIPFWGWVVALATAMQESGLRNLPHLGDRNDHDSIGVFQQRPSQGWGAPGQLADPAYQAGKFYDKLLTISGWQRMPLTQAAQAVQVSAFPDAYAKWTDEAIRLAEHVGSAILQASPGDLEQGVSNPAPGFACWGGVLGAAESLPAGFNLPAGTPPAVVTAVWWALGQLGTPYSFGGDCTAARSGNPAHECDCSSLVQMAYRAGGVVLPRTTSEQVHIGVSIGGLPELRVGDLVFIPGGGGTFANPGHVGLYIGQGLLVQAPQTGDVVKISPVSSWAGQVAAIRRVVW